MSLPSVPWRKVVKWEATFQAAYFFRMVSLDIWRARRVTSAVFEELKFGETSLATVREILSHLPPLNSDSLIYDLGCGRGRAAFLFHFVTGATVLALDAVPAFVETGRRLARLNGCDSRVLFYWEDFRFSDLEPADLFYACALCFGAATRQALLAKILDNKPGAHLVTVGWKPEHPRLLPVAHFSAVFSWGPAWVSIHRLAEQP